MNALKYDYFNAFEYIMFVSLGKGTLASPFDNYFREEGPPSASVDSHSFPRKYWRPVNNMGFNGREEESPPLSGCDLTGV